MSLEKSAAVVIAIELVAGADVDVLYVCSSSSLLRGVPHGDVLLPVLGGRAYECLYVSHYH